MDGPIGPDAAVAWTIALNITSVINIATYSNSLLSAHSGVTIAYYL